MKYKFLILILLLVAVQSFGQWPPGYTGINARYDWLAGKFRNGLNVPAGTSAALFPTQYVGAGALYYDSTGADSGLYVYGRPTWHKLALSSATAVRFGVTGEDDFGAENRTFDGGTFNFKFTDANIWSVDTARQWRLRAYRAADSANMFIQSSLYGSSGLKRINISAEDSDYLSTIIIDHDHITNEHYHNNPDVINTQFITGVNSFGFINYTPDAQFGFQVDSFYWKPFLGVINIDTLREAHGSDTARNKPMVYDPTTGMWRYSTYWPTGGGAAENFANTNLTSTGPRYHSFRNSDQLWIDSLGGTLPYRVSTLGTGFMRTVATDGTDSSLINVLRGAGSSLVSALVRRGATLSGMVVSNTVAQLSINDGSRSHIVEAQTQNINLNATKLGGGIGSSIFVIADSISLRPFEGIANIDTLASVHGSDTTYKPMVYKASTGQWKYATYYQAGGGSSVSFGTDNQIPHMNAGGTDFDYDADFTWDGNTLYTNAASTQGVLFRVAENVGNFLMAADASPIGSEHYLKSFYASSFNILESSHPNGGEFTIRNIGAGPFQLQSASAQEIRLRPGETTTTVFTSSGQTFTYQSTNELQSLFKDISAPSTPASGYGSLYTNSDKLNFKDDGGVVYILERLASGSRTATATNGTNVASSTPAEEHYIRVGNVVHVSGKITIDCTSASVSSVIDLNLPIASAFTTATDLAGTLVTEANASVTVGRMEAETTNDRMTVTFIPYSDASLIYSYTYSYKIL